MGIWRARSWRVFNHVRRCGPLDVAQAGKHIRLSIPGVGTRTIRTQQGALLVLLPLGLCAAILFLGGDDRGRRVRQKHLAQEYAVTQGRPLPQVVATTTQLRGPGIPLALLDRRPVGIAYAKDSGHGAYIAPTRSGKGLHQTEVLLSWPGAGIIVDPKGEQWERTAGWRAQHVGPVYRLPQVGMNLLDYFDLGDALDTLELHKHLLRPWMDRESIFADKCLALFDAAFEVSQATGDHPLRLLADWARRPVKDVLLEARAHAPRPIDVFLDGDVLDDDTQLNRFTQSAWGTFTTRFGAFVPHIDTVATGEIPKTWAQQNATIYITYPLDQLQMAGALVSAILAGLIKGQMRQAIKQHTLVIIDELPTVALFNLDTYLATVGGYGVTILNYIQALSQIYEVYGQNRARSILANCHHQVWYPPRDPETAEYVSKMFGTELQFVRSESVSSGSRGTGGTNQNRSVSYQQIEKPALDVPALLALPEEAVVLFTTLAGRQYRALAQRMNPIPRLKDLPPPPDAPTLNSAATPVIRPVDRARPPRVFPGTAAALTGAERATDDAGAPDQVEPLPTVVPPTDDEDADAPNGAAAPVVDDADQGDEPSRFW